MRPVDTPQIGPHAPPVLVALTAPAAPTAIAAEAACQPILDTGVKRFEAPAETRYDDAKAPL